VLTDEDRAVQAAGGTVLADVSAHNAGKVAPPPPPETAAAFSKKSGESNGVIAMIDLLIADLTKEITEAKTTEKDAQADYEQAMTDSAEKRATDSKGLADKQKAKADTNASMEANTEEKAATTKTLMATLEYIQSLHAECDWLLQYFEVRKEARTGEIDSLKSAKSVLSGADFSLVETGRRSLRGAGSNLKFAAKAKLDINQKVYIENQPVLGDGAGEGALNVCRSFAAQHVSDASKPAVRVCGTGIKMTAYLMNECDQYYEHSRQIGQCNTGAPPSTCDAFSPAEDPRFGHYQSYKIEPC
jgi:hypothetical protein